MTETLLHYLWRNRLYRTGEYYTVQGEKIGILHPGFPNDDAGPDFKQAIIKIGEITWAGDVELHLRTSDWERHNHTADEKYNRVVLHVVYIHDREIVTQSGRSPAIFELRPWILQETIERYAALQNSAQALPCRQGLEQISPLLFNAVLARVNAERMLRRRKVVEEMVQSCQHSWQEAFFRQLLLSYGFKTNTPAFELLGRSLPFSILQKHLTNQVQTYALLFGQAGMLTDDEVDDYISALSEEYVYLKQKYRLHPIVATSWNLRRLRPQNFPGMRLAQLSQFLHKNPKVFHTILACQDIESLTSLFRTEPHPYWKTHYMIGVPSDNHTSIMGIDMANLLVINGIVPFLYSYGTFMGNIDLQERAFHLLETLPYEKNKITTQYQKYGFPAENALQSQGVLELSQCYCKKRKCLDCGIGQKLLHR